MSEWISVKDRLPELHYEDDSKCVIACNSTHQFIAYVRYNNGGSYPPEWIQAGRDGYKIEDITHWMPLPKFPIEA